jgi:hypothetical protein
VARQALRNQHGVSFVAVLIALLIGAALYFGYFTLHDGTGRRSVGVAAIDSSRAVACRANRQTIERALIAWAQTHDGETASLNALAADGVHLPSCPEGGTYSLTGNSVRCSAHP